VAYKVFTNGSVLNASEVNENLMNQSVITFTSATARSSAITSPIEGMITYLEDSNSYQTWDGSAWVGLVPQSGNAIINGAFEVNQRNFTSASPVSNTFIFDRWFAVPTGGTITYSSQDFALGSAPEVGYEAANFLRILTSGQSAAGDRSIVQQKIESVRTFAGQTVTLSFWAKAASGTPKIAAEIQQVFGTGGSPSTIVAKLFGQATLSTSWQRFSITSSVDSIAGKTLGTNKDDLLAVNLWTSAGTDWNSRTGSLGVQNNTIDIWGVQLEAGPVATPFRRNANSLQGELAACQRYYFRNSATAQAFNTLSPFGQASSTTACNISFVPPVTMRVAPTSVDFSTLRLQEFTAGIAVTAVGLDGGSTATNAVLSANVASGLVQFRNYVLSANNSSSAFIGFSAEL
jgi:hypothetical protein